MMQLQASVGNVSARFVLSKSAAEDSPLPGRPALMRYGTGEHAQLGGGRAVPVNGVRLSEGELIAMGDFFASPDELFKASAGDLKRLVALIRRDKAAVEGRPGARPVATKEWEKATKGRYLELAKKNAPHFAPKFGTAGVAGDDHRGEWRKHHTAALDLAHAHAATDKSVPAEATARNAFAGHFLTDAFSAGHIVSKSQMMGIAKRKFQALKTDGLMFKENAFTKAVARDVLADPKVKRKLAGRQLKLVSWGQFSPQRFSELLWQIHKKSPDAFFSAFAKIVHDKLNDDIKAGKGAGIDVENDRGEAWSLSGDDTLHLSPETKRIAQAAVDESHQNLERAAKTAGPLDYDVLYKNVWTFTPRLTSRGVTQVRDVARVYLDAGNAKTVSAFTKMSIEQIDVAIAELRKEGRIRRKPPSEGLRVRPCFPGHVLIAMCDGTRRPIRDVLLGDTVVGYDLRQHRTTEAVVTATFRHEASSILRVEFTMGFPPLDVTGEHPIWSEDLQHWTAAEALRPGERVISFADGSPGIVKIREIARVPSPCGVHNLSTGGQHNYFAGGILVHNKGP